MKNRSVSNVIRYASPIPQRSWAVRTNVGDVLGPGIDLGTHRSRLDYFLPRQLIEIVSLTSLDRHKRVKEENNSRLGEILNLFGVMIIAKRFEFGSTRASLCGWTGIGTASL
jgi:hypothetical protein